MIKLIKRWITHKRVQKRIKEAASLSEKDGRKRLVLMVKGKPHVFTKRQLQTLIQKKYFVAGTTIQEIERIALFITLNRCKNVS